VFDWFVCLDKKLNPSIGILEGSPKKNIKNNFTNAISLDNKDIPLSKEQKKKHKELLKKEKEKVIESLHSFISYCWQAT